MSQPFHIYRKGERFEGVFTVEGHHLIIRTAYGTRRAVLGLIRPVKLAKALYRAQLRDIARHPLLQDVATQSTAAPPLH